MKTRQLGKTELNISVVGFGCARIGGFSAAGPRRKDSIRLLEQALDAGITFFDTADAYANGDSEHLIGQALSGKRQQFVLSTKGGYEFKQHLGSRSRLEPVVQGVRKLAAPLLKSPPVFSSQNFSSGYLTRSVENSLRRLKTDYIDLYQLHAPRSGHSQDEEIIDTLRSLKRAGKIRYFGVGLESLDDVERWLSYDDISSLQIPFGVLDQEALEHTMAAAKKKGAGLLVRGIFGGGWLNTNMSATQLYHGTPKWRRVRAYRDLAQVHGYTLHAMALNFALHQPGVTAAVIGMRTSAHLTRNLALEIDDAGLPADVATGISRINEYAPLGP